MTSEIDHSLSLSKFHRFPDLPLELRRRVWSFAVPKRRVVDIFYPPEPKHWQTLILLIYRPYPIPLLSVCHESRAFTLATPELGLLPPAQGDCQVKAKNVTLLFCDIEAFMQASMDAAYYRHLWGIWKDFGITLGFDLRAVPKASSRIRMEAIPIHRAQRRMGHESEIETTLRRLASMTELPRAFGRLRELILFCNEDDIVSVAEVKNGLQRKWEEAAARAKEKWRLIELKQGRNYGQMRIELMPKGTVMVYGPSYTSPWAISKMESELSMMRDKLIE